MFITIHCGRLFIPYSIIYNLSVKIQDISPERQKTPAPCDTGVFFKILKESISVF